MLNLRLTTPKQHFEPDEDFELNPGALEKSLKELQSTPMIERIGLIDAAITRFNEVNLDHAKRVKLLEVYFNAYQKLLQGFDEMRIAQLNVSAQQKKQVKKDLMWLYIKLAHGYEIVVKDFASNNPYEKPGKDIILAAFRALELSCTSLLYSYRFDLEEPPLCYMEMNQLYAFAEFYEIQNTSIRAAQGYAKTPTIESFYILCVLFMNIDPRQYESYTLEVLFLALQPLVFQCKLSKKINYSADSYYYSVNLNENAPAEILLDDKVTAISKSTRYITVDAFMKEIQDWLDKNQKNENSLLIEQELEFFPSILTRLKINHSQKSPRSETVEKEKDSNLNSDACHLIVGLAPLESLLIMDEVGMDLKLDFNESHWCKISETSKSCELLSSSDGFPEQLSLGELVGIVTHNKDCNNDKPSQDKGDDSEEGNDEESEEGPIRLQKIGQIIALRQMEDNKLLIELEYIVGKAHPLTYRRLNSEDKAIEYTSSIGIYINDDENPEIPPKMIVSNKHFRLGQHYLIITRERCFSIEACEPLKKSMLYSFFGYKVLQPSVSNPNIPAQASRSAAN